MTPQAADPFASPIAAPPSFSLDFGSDVLIPNSGEVRDYLAQFPEILSWLPEMIAETLKEFGPQARLSLVHNHDPEIYDPFLIIRVRPAEPGPMFDRLDRIAEKFRSRQEGSDGWVLVMWDNGASDRTHAV
jgi:hypothetical protein